jgi:hypothetical protein
MVSIPKIIGVMSLSFTLVLCLRPFSLAQEANSIGPDQCAEGKDGPSTLTRCREKARQGIHTVEGNVLQVEFDYLTVQRSDGKELKMHIDESTEMIGCVAQFMEETGWGETGARDWTVERL